ncbi:MAG: ATP-binding protein [Burkholderiaceae bacterium]
MRKSGVDSGPDSGSILKAMSQAPMSRWQGWRLRILVVLALLGCLLMLQLAREVAASPNLDGSWVVTPQGRLELHAAHSVGLKPYVGKRLAALSAQGLRVDLREASLVQRSPRWLIDDTSRAQQLVLHQRIARVLALPEVTLTFEDGKSVSQAVRQRDVGDLPALFWLLCACAMALYLLSMAVLLIRPSLVNLLYVAMALCQVGNLSFNAVESAFDLGMPPRFLGIDFAVRSAFDLTMGAAAFHVASIWPHRFARARRWASLGWAAALLSLACAALLTQLWWWLQGATTLLALSVVAVLIRSYRLEPRPATLAQCRFALLSTGLWMGLTAGLALTSHYPSWQGHLAVAGSTVWYLLLAVLLFVVPLLSRVPRIVREFWLLVVVSALAVLLDLLLVDAFGRNRFMSAALSLSIAIGIYTVMRQWLLARLLGAGMITTERMFERLYRIARDVESHPDRTPKLLAELLTELFDPIRTRIIQDPASRIRVTDDGSTMQVPVPGVAADAQGYDGSIVLRFAQRGNRLFTSEDIRLAERIVEQLERAVAYDRAVEHGRAEERLRIAQDLHDDIGARLLTLIYKAQSPEMEEYARHTLQDLKTLTRGLAASSHRLSHAAAEWKTDLTQRLSAANIDLAWSCEFDEDLLLGMVQWSALTRVLRELVSNAIAHSAAARVEISVRLERDCVQLSVCDDGEGRGPTGWAHGLGLSGVRKRVKQINGQVQWLEAAPRGICCHVSAQNLSGRSPDRQGRTTLDWEADGTRTAGQK